MPQHGKGTKEMASKLDRTWRHVIRALPADKYVPLDAILYTTFVILTNEALHAQLEDQLLDTQSNVNGWYRRQLENVGTFS